MLELGSTTGPVTRAIQAVRQPHVDAAIARMLTERDPLPAPEPQQKLFGPAREHLRSLPMNGLVALLEAYQAAGNLFMHHANAPRAAEGNGAAGTLMDVASETARWAQQEIIDEIESRRPTTQFDRGRRRTILARWWADGEEWLRVRDLAIDALQRVEG